MIAYTAFIHAMMQLMQPAKIGGLMHMHMPNSFTYTHKQSSSLFKADNHSSVDAEHEST